MGPPNGPDLARSGSTWIHWWSPVASAKRFTWSWVISVQSVYPMCSPTRALRSSMPEKLAMPRETSGPLLANLLGQDGAHERGPVTAAGPGRNAFIVSWDEDEAIHLASLLSEAGWIVALEHSDGNRAWKRIKEGRPDLVVVDFAR